MFQLKFSFQRHKMMKLIKRHQIHSQCLFDKTLKMKNIIPDTPQRRLLLREPRYSGRNSQQTDRTSRSKHTDSPT